VSMLRIPSRIAIRRRLSLSLFFAVPWTLRGTRTPVMVVMNFSQIPSAGAHYSEPGTAYRSGR
jgi:hypothetical protein